MATWREILASEVDPDSPVTSTLMTAVADNPTAIAEGAAGAPRIAVSASQSDRASPGNLFFDNMDDFQGIEFFYSFSASGPSTFTFAIAYSDDGGSTYPNTFTIHSVSGATSGFGAGFLDFATGSIITQENSGTLTGASLNITDIRFSGTTSDSMTMNLYVRRTGGISAT